MRKCKAHRGVLVVLVILAVCGGLACRKEAPSGQAGTANATGSQSAQAQPDASSATAEALTADSLVGTAWQAGPLKFQFGEGGSLKVGEDAEGTWTVTNGQVSLETDEMTYALQIRGTDLAYGDMTLERLAQP